MKKISLSPKHYIGSLIHVTNDIVLFPQTCIPTLLNLSTDTSHNDNLRLASIQALVNLSVSGQCGESFEPPALHSLFSLLGDGLTALGQQALRVLVNLSADSTVTPTLLCYEVTI